MENSGTRKFLRLAARVCVGVAALGVSGSVFAAGTQPVPAVFKQYCFGCHSNALATARINLQQLTAEASAGEHFPKWRRVMAMLEEKRMPPEKMRQPSDGDRAAAVAWIRGKLQDYIVKNAGDPGHVTVRRLTSGEYAYSVHDLTGLDLKFGEFATDSVGGEGFTNYGDVQFMADANLERYLEAAKEVADHAVIGAGPLTFFDDPGKSGFELSAMNRITHIYRKYGFRANSGEGGKPYGMDKYSNVFFTCWRYQHRAALGEPKATLDSISAREGVSPRFAQHIWTVLHQRAPSYPASEVVAAFQRMPAVVAGHRDGSIAAAREASEDVMRAVVDWPRWLLAAGGVAEGGEGDERALVLNDATLEPSLTHHFTFAIRTRRDKSTRVYLSVAQANKTSNVQPVVIWRNAMVTVRANSKAVGEARPLRELLDETTRKRLGFDHDSFTTTGPVWFEVKVPEGSLEAGLEMDAEVDAASTGDAVVRTVLSNREELSKGVPMWALLGDPNNAGVKKWKSDVLEFARVLPQNSQGEAAPADKDPIPAPFLNTYNQPERDHFHAKLKYWRTDGFLREHMLDDATRQQLDQAWDDLLSSFDYHQLYLEFVAKKYYLDLKKKTITDLQPADIEAMPAEPRKYVAKLKSEYDSIQKAEQASHPRHLRDCLELASKAWRRPLTAEEKDGLRSFYVKLTEGAKLDHGKAIESVIARILVAPQFLYRVEQPAQEARVKPLSQWELASRLSYFLWSSIPDDELRRAAAAGELSDRKHLDAQVKRMLADAKIRRFSTEFFGQWLGFYHFDQSHGVDTKRFPEFTDDVKQAMYEEAIGFFQHVVQKDRPVREMLTADYTYLNKALAKHYGIKADGKLEREPELVQGATAFHRGGMLRLGAVLTATSAPLRTSPVKRGDWVLRRVLGTPTPPPPANAGSIPADDQMFGGMSVKQRLAVHQRNATCASCHSRIDPMGFPLEHYDPVGRWRESYADGKAIEDTSTTTNGTDIAGVEGLLSYLRTQEPQVLRTMSSKLIGYALGRTVMGSDEPLIERLTAQGGDTTFSKMIAEVVASRQFRYRREREQTPQPASTEQTRVTPAVADSPKEGGNEE